MEDLEKKIEEAADKFAVKGGWQCPVSFIEGAKSSEAKAFHQQGMYTEEEAMNLAYQLWEGFLHETKEYPNFDSWFNDNKKK